MWKKKCIYFKLHIIRSWHALSLQNGRNKRQRVWVHQIRIAMQYETSPAQGEWFWDHAAELRHQPGSERQAVPPRWHIHWDRNATDWTITYLWRELLSLQALMSCKIKNYKKHVMLNVLLTVITFLPSFYSMVPKRVFLRENIMLLK